MRFTKTHCKQGHELTEENSKFIFVVVINADNAGYALEMLHKIW